MDTPTPDHEGAPDPEQRVHLRSFPVHDHPGRCSSCGRPREGGRALQVGLRIWFMCHPCWQALGVLLAQDYHADTVMQAGWVRDPHDLPGAPGRN